MKRRLGILFLALTLVAVMSMPLAAAEEQITLRIVWWGSQARHDNTLAAIDMFMEQNPNIKIDAQYMIWDGYWEMMATQIAGNNMADVFQQDYQYLKQYADNGIMYNLNEFIESGVINTEFIDENTLLGGAVDGNVYAISLGLNSQCVAWNPELFEQAGVEPPKDTWTWEEYIKTATALTEALGIFGDETFPVNYFHGPNLWMRQHGYSFYADDGSGLGYPDDQLLADYYQMDLDLTNAGATTSADLRDELETMSIEQIRFVTGEAAMFSGMGGSNQLAAVVTASGDKPFKLAPLPHLEGETSGQFLKPSQFFSVYSGTQHPEEAARFIDFVTNNVEANLECLKGERGVPISSKVREALEPTLNETQKEIYRYIGSLSEIAWPIGLPEPPQHGEINTILRNVRNEMLAGGITPLEAAQKVRSEAERVFAGK